MTRLPRPLRSLHAWLEASDPASVRRRQAVRASLAALCTWLTVRTIMTAATGRPQTAEVLFGVTVCFVVSIVIADPLRVSRLVTVALGAAVTIAMVALSAYTAHVPFVQKVLLLALVFVSFAARRFGLRAGELALLAVMTLYFAASSGASPDNVGWFVAASLAGVLWLLIWQFVLIPYDPKRSLEQAGLAFYRRAGELVGDVGWRVRDLGGNAPSDRRPPRLHRRLQLVGVSRRVMASQFPGTLAPTGWTRGGLSQLQLAMYSAEQGLAQMVEAVSFAEDGSRLPSHIAESVAATLDLLQTALMEGASPGAMRELADRARAASEEIASRSERSSSVRSTSWTIRAVNLTRGAQRVARSVATARDLTITALAGRQGTPAGEAANPPGAQPAAPAPQAMVGRRIKVRPATAQGLQALVATGLAMLVGAAFGVDRTTWVYWTAFLVIAGSAGESLRRITLRIAGTTLGAVCGVGLALLLPDRTVAVVAIVTVALFATVYIAPVSYPLMVFFMNVGFVVAFTQLGARELDVLVDRPLTTLLGGAVAAFVTVVLFPIRVTERFRRALGQYLGLICSATEAMVQRVVDGADIDRADPDWERANVLYGMIQQTMAAVAFESNPFSRTETTLSTKVVKVAAVDAAFNRAMTSTPSSGRPAFMEQRAQMMATLRDRIGADVVAIQQLLAGQSTSLTASLFDLEPGENEQGNEISILTRMDPDGGVLTLAALHRNLVQLALALGGSVESAEAQHSVAGNGRNS